MKTFRVGIAVVIITMSLLVACSSPLEESTKDETATHQVNTVPQLPSFSMMDINGNKVSFDSFRGKKVFVNLWATWCPPCRREIPSIEKLYKEANKEKAVFVLLSLDENFEAVKEFAIANKLHVPVFYPAEQLPDLFKVEAIPATYIFDEQGKLIKHINSMDNYYTSEYLKLFK